MLELIINNDAPHGEPAPPAWDELLDHTLVSFSLSKQEVRGICSAFMQMADAVGYAVAAHRELAADPDKALTYAHRALAEAQCARRIGAEVFQAITAKAERVNGRKPRKPASERQQHS
jgi:hypothetical protein